MDPGVDRSNFEVSRITIKSILSRSRKSTLSRILLWIAPITFLALFYFFPFGSILQESFRRSEEGILTSLFEVIKSDSLRGILWFTIWQATISTILTMIIGLPGAYLLARYDFKGKSLIKAMTGIAFVLPTLVVAAAFNAMLGPQGIINQGIMAILKLEQPPLHFTNTLGAILIAHVFYNVTIVLRLVGDFWSHIDPRQSQAASVLGANRIKVLWHVTLPLLLPAIASAALLIFIFSFTSFGVILVLGGPQFSTIETEIYYQTISLFNLPLAATLAIIQLICTLALTIAYTRLLSKVSRPISLRSRKYTQKKITSWRSRIFASIVLLTLMILVVTPLFALAFRSVSSFKRADSLTARQGYGSLSWSGFSFDNYRELNINRRESLFYIPTTTTIGISLAYAGATVTLSLILSLPAAWALSRSGQSLFNRLMDPLLMLPLGTSAVTLGLGFIIALDHPPLDLRSSVLLIPLAHTLVAFPFVVRSLTPALRSISPNLRNAAAIMGAKPGTVFWQVDLPIIGRALLVGAIFAFTISLGEFGATALIARPEYPTIPIAIYRLIGRPGALNYGQAIALSTILMLVTGIGIFAIEKFRIADVGEF